MKYYLITFAFIGLCVWSATLPPHKEKQEVDNGLTTLEDADSVMRAEYAEPLTPKNYHSSHNTK